MPRTATPPSAAWLPRSLSHTLTHTLRTHIARFAGAQRAHACSLAGRSGPQPRRVQRLAHLLLQGAFAARARAHRACGASPAGQRLRVGAGGAGPPCRRSGEGVSGEGVCAYAAGDRSRTRRADTGGEDQENTARMGAITRGRGGARVGARERARSKSSSQAGSAQGRGGGGAVGSGAACCVAAWDQTLDDDEEEEEEEDDDDDDDDVML